MRDRVFGIETEYALIYHPGRGESARPQNLTLYGYFEAALRRRVRSLPNAFSPFRAKLGRFLENGGTFHYEASVQDYEHGLIELASPECRDPLTLVTYERAKDELIEELALEVNEELALAGWRGRVSIGKNNVDSAGHTFGSHENYWVEDRLSPGQRAVFVPLWVVLWAVSLPVLALVVAVQVIATLGILFGGLALLILAPLLALVRPNAGLRLATWIQRGGAHLEANPGDLARRLQHLVAPIYPLIDLHSAFYNRFHLRGFRRDLTAFLATRAIFAGAGAVGFDGGPLFRLAQRPPFLRVLSRIFPEGDQRPLFETRELFFRPLSALRSKRRLHLLVGDSNLCEHTLFLRVGTTLLVLEALEADPGEWPELVDPLESLRAVSLDVEMRAPLALRGGGQASSLEIQRTYLERVRRTLRRDGGELEPWKERVLRAWSEVLDLLERDPDALADRLDWVAKRRLVRAELRDPGDADELVRRGAEVLRSSGPADARLRAIAYRVWRADLRYHELGPRGGYRRLERAHKVQRLSDVAAVERARREPPSDTRARARGEAIRWAHTQALSGGAAWHRVRVGKFDWRWYSDPLDPGGPVPRDRN